MDFVQWGSVFLARLLELQEGSGAANTLGVCYNDLGPALFGPAWPSRPRSTAISQAIADLKGFGLIEQDWRLPQYLTIPRHAREAARNQKDLWVQICSKALEPDEAQLLRALNRLSEQRQPDFAYLDMVPYEELYPALGLAPGYEATQNVERRVRNLHGVGFAQFSRESNSRALAARPTYFGLVWEHRRSITLRSQEIDALVEEGETPTVDLKRQLALDTASHKAELIKDVIALANTKGPGPRYLIIGFTDEGDYYEPENPQERAERDRLLDALSEERLQTIVSTYTDPVLRVRYTKAGYHRGPVGMLQVHRDTTELPYAVRKTLGSTDKTDKSARQVRQGQVFLRDGTVTRAARLEEIERLRADAERVRQRQQHNEIS